MNGDEIMNIIPETYCGYAVPADYRAFAQNLAAERCYDYPLRGLTLDLSLLPAAQLAEIYLGNQPRYAFLQTVEFFKPLKFDRDSPALSVDEIQHGLVIGSANDGDLFINLHDGSVCGLCIAICFLSAWRMILLRCRQKWCCRLIFRIGRMRNKVSGCLNAVKAA